MAELDCETVNRTAAIDASDVNRAEGTRRPNRPSRPGPLQWLWYSVGGGLAPRFNEWVLHDTTCGTWALRQVLRSCLVLTPLIAVVLVIPPGPFWIRAMAALGGVIMAMIFSIGYIVETTEHRLKKAGYPVGTGERTRGTRSTTHRSDAVARRRKKMFDRMDRRREK
ncbi:MAG TPA: DUF5313 family protein [Jatrophihabitans sp.]|jgi:hypothetical protein